MGGARRKKPRKRSAKASAPAKSKEELEALVGFSLTEAADRRVAMREADRLAEEHADVAPHAHDLALGQLARKLRPWLA